jgi:hypothetical protein
MDCLPPPEQWSLKSRWLMIQEHLEALRWHLEKLETTATARELIAAREHLREICLRGAEAHSELEQLNQLPQAQLNTLD